MLIQIPPAYGYGAQGSGETIPPNSTLWFVIDVTKGREGLTLPRARATTPVATWLPGSSHS